MKFPHRWRLPLLALTCLGILYLAGYSYVRSRHYLVHSSGFAAGTIDNHRIAVGDLGLGFNSAYRVAGLSYWVFTPLRWLETGYWYLRHPAGQSWPYGGNRPDPQMQLTGEGRIEK